MIVLIEGEDAGPELLGGLHGPQHRVEDLIVEGLPHIEADYVTGLLLTYIVVIVAEHLVEINIILLSLFLSIFFLN